MNKRISMVIMIYSIILSQENGEVTHERKK